MDAQSPGSPTNSANALDLLATCMTVLAPAGFALLWLLASLLVARRLSGNLTVPLDTPLLLATGWMLFAGGVGLHACWKQSSAQEPFRRSLVFFAVAILPMVICAAMLTLPGSPPLGLGLLWLLVGGSAAWSIYTDWSPPVGLKTDGRTAPVMPDSNFSRSNETSPIDLSVEPMAEDLLQQFMRTRAKDGSERVAGLVRAEFQSGERQASLHIAFCPPFEKTPELDVEQLEGAQARIKVGQLQPFGVRLDLRLSRPETEPQNIVVRFEAREHMESDAPEERTSPKFS